MAAPPSPATAPSTACLAALAASPSLASLPFRQRVLMAGGVPCSAPFSSPETSASR